MVWNTHDFFPFFSLYKTKKHICVIAIFILLLSCISISGCLTINQPSNNSSCTNGLTQLKFSQELKILFNGTEKDINEIDNSSIKIQIDYLIPTNNEMKPKISESYKFANWEVNNNKTELTFDFIFKPSDNNFINVPSGRWVSFNITLFISSNSTSLSNMKFFNEINTISGKIYYDGSMSFDKIVMDKKNNGISFINGIGSVMMYFNMDCIFNIEFKNATCN